MRSLELKRLVDLLEELRSYDEGEPIDEEIEIVLRHIRGELEVRIND